MVASKLHVLTLIAISLCLRFAGMLFLPLEPRNIDMNRYLEQAYYLATQHVFFMDGTPTAFNGPLYPFILALLVRNLRLVQIFLVICGTGTAVLTYYLARAILSNRWSFVAALGVACGPMSVRWSSVLLTDTLFTLLSTLGLYWWARRKDVAAGVAWGLSLLTRPLPLLFLPLTRRKWLIATAILIVLPWIARNWIVFHRPMLVSAGIGQNLLIGTLNFSTHQSAWDQITETQFFEKNELDQMTEAERDEAKSRLAIQRITNQPLSWLQARAKQYPLLFADMGQYLFETEGRAKQFIKPLFLAGNFLFLCLGIYGLWCVRDRFWELDYLVLWPIYVALIHLPLWCEARYALPIVPSMCILAVLGLRGPAFDRLLRVVKEPGRSVLERV